MREQMRVLGIDPGTVSFDLCLLEDSEVVYEESLASNLVAERPEIMAAKCIEARPDLLAAPSGYGLPNRKLNQLQPRDYFELTLVRDGERVPVLDAMKKFFAIISRANLDVLFLPGIIHLPTVPNWRKFNKIDMGTADKMCIGALSVEMISRIKHKPYDRISHLVLEMGGGYNSLIAIEKGKIINGIGGTLFPGPGYVNSGAMDGEVAYLLGKFGKDMLFRGGVSSQVGEACLPMDSFTQGRYPDVFEAFKEGILFAVCSQKTVTDTSEVYLSGRLMRYENIRRPLHAELNKMGYSVNLLPVLSPGSKAAAQGYAMVGNGISGGYFSSLVRHMEIDKASGSVTDHLYFGVNL